MAKTDKPQDKNYVMYIGPHPSVAVPDIDGEFIRDEAKGPLDAETIARLCVKDKEFVACVASTPQKAPDTSGGGTGE